MFPSPPIRRWSIRKALMLLPLSSRQTGQSLGGRGLDQGVRAQGGQFMRLFTTEVGWTAIRPKRRVSWKPTAVPSSSRSRNRSDLGGSVT